MAAARDQRRAVPVALALAVLAGTALVAAPASAAPQATTAPLTVSIVVPITARAGDDGLLDAETLEIATSPAGSLTRELDEVLTTPATIALDPMILASIRVLGSAAPDSALEWLDRLEAASNEVFLLAYSDADLTALVRAGALDLADPLGFGFALDPAAFGPAQTASPTPQPTETPAPDDDAPPPLPTTDELLAWPQTIGRIAWPSARSVAGSDLDAYAQAGYDAVLLSSANVSETSSGLADIGGLRAVVADSAASELFRQASASIDDATRGQVITRLGAALDGLAAAHPGRSVVLTLERAAGFAFYGLAETIDALTARESTRVAGISEVLAGSADAARIVESPEPDHVAAAPDLVAAVRAEAEFATILADPLLLTAERRLELLVLLAVPTADDVEWPQRADAFLESSAALRSAVTIVDTGDVFVTSTDTYLPIRIANGLDHAVTVRLDARALRPQLRVDSPTEVTIEPGSSKTVRLEAQAITNGQVRVEARLSSPSTGVPIGAPHLFTADLQAQWETVGLAVGAVVALVFAAGIVRNVVVRRRRSARDRDEEAPAAE